MKKTMALMMALLLCLLCVPALADDAVQTQTYTHAGKGYAIDVPADWLCVDKTNIQQYIDAYEKGEMSFMGTNAQTLQSLMAQVVFSDCAVLISQQGNNIVIVAEDIGIELTNEQFVTLMIPVLKQQLTSQIPTIQFTAEGEIVPFGANEFIVLAAEYDMNGLSAAVDMLFYLEGTTMYTLTLTTTSVFGQAATDAFYTAVQQACATFTTGK